MLVPLIHRLSKRTGKALLVFALPLLAGLAVTHAFIPPTPGPIAVADLLGADLGYVIMFGALAGLPAMILGGPVLARAYRNTAVSTLEELVLFGFVIAFLVRIAQGSATVAMITAAGLTAPVAAVAGLGPADTALLVIAIASGATMTSHVNDSGFWLVNQYLEQTPEETLKSWTVATTVMGLTGVAVACIISIFV